MNAPSKKPTPAGETVEEALEALKPQLTKLRAEFPKNQISKLPKETRAQIDARKAPNGKSLMVFNCPVCGGHHHKDAVHLDYVGHAALTDRLLDTDLEWTWEPVGFTPEGLPALDRNGGLWIKLTVCGVTRYGYGSADGKSGGDAMKEMIGDALRNAAMRFGAALDLWHKGDLHVDLDTGEVGGNFTTGETPPRKTHLDGPYDTIPKLERAAKEFARTLRSLSSIQEYVDWANEETTREFVEQIKRDLPGWWFGGEGCPDNFTPLSVEVDQTKRGLKELAELENQR